MPQGELILLNVFYNSLRSIQINEIRDVHRKTHVFESGKVPLLSSEIDSCVFRQHTVK